jgi:hypothetical protein
LRGQVAPAGPPQTGEYAQIAGFIYESYTPDTAVIGLVIKIPTSVDATALTVTLKWRGDDWQMVAPPGGMWTSVRRYLTGMTGVVKWGPQG